MGLSMLEPVDAWNPFDLLVERDSSRGANPDLSFRAPGDLVPVVGVVLIPHQPEYGARDRHGEVDAIVEELLGRRPMAAVRLDTELEENRGGLRSPEEIESVIARMDAVITTRMHGMVLSIRRGVPPVAIDAVDGGGKVGRQAATIGWPACLPVEDLTVDRLQGWFEWCLTEEAREETRRCAQRARDLLADAERRLLAEIAGGG
jgi:hypothetical protein